MEALKVMPSGRVVEPLCLAVYVIGAPQAVENPAAVTDIELADNS